jgi:LPS sulfotransferase NodH
MSPELLQGRPTLRQILEGRSVGQTMHRSSYSTDEILAVLDRIGRRLTGPQGVLSLKVMWSDYERVLLARGLDLGHWGAPVTWLRIRRLDHVRQAVSWSRALQTGQWNSASSSRLSPLFNPQQIENCLAMAKDWDASWDSYFNRLGIQPFTLHYEDLSADYKATICDVFDHLGLSDHAIPPAHLRRQADFLNENWLKQFEAWQANRGARSPA